MATNKVYEENTFYTASEAFSDGGKVTVEQDAFVRVNGSAAILLNPATTWTVKVDGQVQSTNNGVHFNSNLFSDPVKNSKLTLGTEGAIQSTGSNFAGVFLGVPVDVANSGYIEGDGFGISADLFGVTSSKGFTITNNASGEITGDIGISNKTSLLLTVKNQGLIEGTTAGIEWAGAAAITNSGTIEGDLRSINTVTLLAASITNSGRVGGDILLSNGDDTVKNTGRVDNTVALWDGKNSLTNSGDILGQVTAGSGNDTLINSGTMGNLVHLGNGTNKVTNSGVIEGDVQAGSGDDTMVNSGTIDSFVYLREGANKLTNSGVISGDVLVGSADDIVINTKTILGNVTLYNGNDSFTNSGSVSGVLDAGAGNDVVKNTGTIETTVQLGGGDDSFIGGKNAEAVQDDLGNDVYKLGGGDDTLWTAGSGIDSFDGGTGTDYFDISAASDAFLINLGVTSVTLGGETLQAASAFTLGGAGGSIKGFELVIGSGEADIIVGSSAAERILGQGGVDILAGGGGADILTGGPTQNDTFVYLSIKDSGPTRATRDTIKDFYFAGGAGGDLIDLAAIDANTKQSGNDAFTFIGNDQPFTPGIAGQLRAVDTEAGTVIQGDVNGDAKVDFSILVVGAHTFDATDFML